MSKCRGMSQPTWWRGGRGLPSLIALFYMCLCYPVDRYFVVFMTLFVSTHFWVVFMPYYDRTIVTICWTVTGLVLHGPQFGLRYFTKHCIYVAGPRCEWKPAFHLNWGEPVSAHPNPSGMPIYLKLLSTFR